MSGPSRAAPARREHLLARLAHALLQGRTLDRLLRGRTAIALVAFALIGIVTLQLGLLKLNAGVGRTLQREAALQRTDAQLSIENAELASGERVQARAAAAGMTPAPPRALRFLQSAGQADAGRGAAALKPPSSEAHASWGEGGESSGEAGESSGAAEAHQGSGEAAGHTGAEEAGHEAAAGEHTGTGAGTGSSTEAPAEASHGGGETASTPAAQSGGGAAAPGG